VASRSHRDTALRRSPPLRSPISTNLAAFCLLNAFTCIGHARTRHAYRPAVPDATRPSYLHHPDPGRIGCPPDPLHHLERNPAMPHRPTPSPQPAPQPPGWLYLPGTCTRPHAGASSAKPLHLRVNPAPNARARLNTYRAPSCLTLGTDHIKQVRTPPCTDWSYRTRNPRNHAEIADKTIKPSNQIGCLPSRPERAHPLGTAIAVRNLGNQCARTRGPLP
jgi:hypothetical protein